MKVFFGGVNMDNGFISPISFNIRERLRNLYKLKGIRIDLRNWATNVAKEMYQSKIIEYSNREGKTFSQQNNDLARQLKRHLTDDHKKPIILETKWIIRYCKFFGCSADYLFGFIDNPTHEITDIRKQIGLSVDAITKLQAITQEWAKVYFPYRTFEEDYKLYKSIPYSNNTDYEKFLSSLDPLTRIKVKEFMRHTTTPAPSIEILSQIITHQLFDTFMQTIVECQNDYNNLQNQLDKLEDSKNQYEDFLKKNPDITPFDDSFDNIYSIMSNDEEKTKSLSKTYSASRFDTSNAFNSLIESICENNK